MAGLQGTSPANAATDANAALRERVLLLAQLSVDMAQNPNAVSEFLPPVLNAAPAHRDYLVRELGKKFPGYAGTISAIGGGRTPPPQTAIATAIPSGAAALPVHTPQYTPPIRRARALSRQDKSAVSLAASRAIGAIAANPGNITTIVEAAYASAPGNKAAIQQRLVGAYPGFAGQIGAVPLAGNNATALTVPSSSRVPEPSSRQRPVPVAETPFEGAQLAAVDTETGPSDVFYSAEEVYDPLEGLNRAIQSFNDGIDFILLRPVAWTYNKLVPDPIIRANRRFFSNLGEPIIAINDTIQLSVEDAAESLVRFGVNSTIGFFGFFEVAESLGFPRHHADFGQTLHHYGTGPGPYLVLPLLGPATARDAVGRVFDIFTDPATYLLSPTQRLGLTAAGAVVRREELLVPLDSLREESLDFYSALRSAYYQTRVRELNKGRIAPAAGEDLDDLFDEAS